MTGPIQRTIRQPVAAARLHLAQVDPAMAALIKRLGPLKLPAPRNPDPYLALLDAVAHQQLHGRAARAMLDRLIALAGGALPAPKTLLALSDEAMRGCGFSASKTAAMRDIAAKSLDGTIPTRAAARRLSDEALIERLVPIRGVGRWTVEMLLIFSLGRADIFPVDDFGVREGYRIIHGLEAQPKPKPFAEIGAKYAPYRSLAAFYLWRAVDAARVKPAPASDAK